MHVIYLPLYKIAKWPHKSRKEPQRWWQTEQHFQSSIILNYNNHTTETGGSSCGTPISWFWVQNKEIWPRRPEPLWLYNNKIWHLMDHELINFSQINRHVKSTLHTIVDPYGIILKWKGRKIESNITNPSKKGPICCIDKNEASYECL